MQPLPSQHTTTTALKKSAGKEKNNMKKFPKEIYKEVVWDVLHIVSEVMMVGLTVMVIVFMLRAPIGCS